MNVNSESMPMTLRMRLQKKLKQDRIDIEGLTEIELNHLRESVKNMTTHTCGTIKLDIDGLQDEIFRHIKQIHSQYINSISQQKSHLKFALIIPFIFGLSLCLALFLGSWSIMEYLASRVQDNLEQIQQLDEQNVVKQRTLENLSQKTWGVELKEDLHGKWIILPSGMTVDTRWSAGQQQALKLVPRPQ